MKLFFTLLFSIFLFSGGFFISLEASRPATKSVFYQKNNFSDSVSTNEKIEKKVFFLSDSVQTQTETLPEKPEKNGLGMMIWGGFLTFLGVVFGVAILLTFLLGFTIGSGFYFKDIYAIAGIMLTGLVIFGVGIYMISRGRERWQEYKKYKKAIKKMRKEA